jgi:hypothetical protein
VKKILIPSLATSSIIIALIFATVSFAQPYSKGSYNADVPYGDLTSLSITTSGNVNVKVLPSSEGTLASGNDVVTVTSTDVMGYKLYIRAINSTSLNNQGIYLPTSANITPSSLTTNTWGYNTDASNNFVGISLNDTLIRSITTPASTGSITNVTYGIKIDLSKPAGNYSATVVYTAVPQTD